MVAIHAVEKNTNIIVACTADEFTNVSEFHLDMVSFPNVQTESFKNYLNDKFDWISLEGDNSFYVRSINSENKEMTTVAAYNITDVYKIYDFTKAANWDAFLTAQGHEFEKEHGRYSWTPKKQEKIMSKPLTLHVLHRSVNTGDHGKWLFSVTGEDIDDIAEFVRSGAFGQNLDLYGAIYFYDENTSTAYVWDKKAKTPSFAKNHIFAIGKKELSELGMLTMSFGSLSLFETPAIAKALETVRFVYAIDGAEVSEERYVAFIARATKTEAKRMTKFDIEKALGYPIVIVD